MFRLGVKAKLLSSILIFNVLVALGVYAYVTRLATDQAEQTAVEAARRRYNMTAELRGYYTAKVIAIAQKKNLEITHDYAQKPDALPLPATFVHELSDAVSKRDGHTMR